MGVHATFCQLCALPTEHVDGLPARDQPMQARYDDSNDPTWRIFLDEMGLSKR